MPRVPTMQGAGVKKTADRRAAGSSFGIFGPKGAPRPSEGQARPRVRASRPIPKLRSSWPTSTSRRMHAQDQRSAPATRSIHGYDEFVDDKGVKPE